MEQMGPALHLRGQCRQILLSLLGLTGEMLESGHRQRSVDQIIIVGKALEDIKCL